MHSTNYYNAFIEVAEDCPVTSAAVPEHNPDKPSVAWMQFDMLIDHPYEFTSDDVFFQIHATRKGLTEGLDQERESFYSKGQACFRASPLTKRYGWGVHSNDKGKVALYPMESDDYQQYAEDPALEHRKAMRTKRS